MLFELAEEHRMLRDMVARFVDEELIPLEPAAWISFEPGGKRVAFQKIGLEFHNWKRYKGGEAEDIYVGTLDQIGRAHV